jgi:AAA+ superfamily predicted ATPase
MSDTANDPEPPFHLFLDEGEVPVAARALRLLISDEAHAGHIREIARAVIAELEQAPNEQGVLTVTLTPQQMKITHSAVRLLFNDLQREQADEREILRAILEKLPDEHVMRAIELE